MGFTPNQVDEMTLPQWVMMNQGYSKIKGNNR